MAITKSELHRPTWAFCDELRGIDAPQYRGCVFFWLIVRYLADRQAGQPPASFNSSERTKR